MDDFGSFQADATQSQYSSQIDSTTVTAMFDDQSAREQGTSFVSDIPHNESLGTLTQGSVATVSGLPAHVVSDQMVMGSGMESQPLHHVGSHEATLDGFSAGSAGPPLANTSFVTAPVSIAKEPQTNKLREWEHKHEIELDAKSKKEVEEKQATRQRAAEELTRWYEERKQQHAKKKSANRADEQVLLQQREAAIQQSANPWERVASLIDQTATKSDVGADDSNLKRADTTRMKQLLIQLKSNPLPA